MGKVSIADSKSNLGKFQYIYKRKIERLYLIIVTSKKDSWLNCCTNQKLNALVSD